MFLKRLEIAGFKSFAVKTVLDFDRGITAVVGPNGSGKSNIADAIRWTLGEQSARTLRTKRGEELVFAGTDKQARASLAEVSLLLDNSDGQMPIDFTEVEIGRRLYRSTEAEYRLAGRRVPLKEVQQLLVQAGFGPNSYSVIGQGMIDSLVLATPAERKLLFEEASGVREFEIKRAETVRRLDATHENLARMRDILRELEPRLRSLAKMAEASAQRSELEAELARRRTTWLASCHQAAKASQVAAAAELKRLQQVECQLKDQVQGYEHQRAQLEAAQQAAAEQQAGLRTELAALEAQRDRLVDDLSVEKAELQLMLESSAHQSGAAAEQTRLKRELAKANKQHKELTQRLEASHKAEAAAQAALEAASREVNTAQSSLTRLRRQSDESSQHQYLLHALSIVRDMARGLDSGAASGDRLKLMLYKVGRLLKLATAGQKDLIQQMQQAQATLTGLMRRREELYGQATEAAMQVRALELALAHQQTRAQELEDKLSAGQDKPATKQGHPMAKRQQMIARLEVQLEAVNVKVSQLRGQLAGQSEIDSRPVFELAASLEAARADLATVHQHIQEVTRRQQEAGQQLAASAGAYIKQASSEPLEAQERTIELLEARLAGYSDDQAEVEEYQAVAERHSFITEQVADLETASADLTEALRHLDELIKKRFEAAFADISQHFGTYFHRLFGGGQASLRLNRGDGAEYGIDIAAVPPGKRTTELSMLSGGERSLVGVALLAAILHRNPSPFIVLDEIDAALDEANSVRLAEILADIAKKTQLIVITHNRRTMQVASVLYGVTMDERHVSRLVSMRLEEAGNLASQQA